MLYLRNPKLNTALKSIVAGLAKSSRTAFRTVGRNGTVSCVRVADLQDHLVNVWFANATTPAEEHVTREEIWEVFAHLMETSQDLSVVRKVYNGQNYVEVFPTHELPFASLVFDPDSFKFTSDTFKEGDLYTALVAFSNSISRKPFEEQTWFTDKYPSASNFTEAVLIMLKEHDITPRNLFSQNDSRIDEVVKLLMVKLRNHGVSRADLFEPTVGQKEVREDVPAKRPVAEVQNSDVQASTEEPTTDFGAKLAGALAKAEEPEVVAEIEADKVDVESAEMEMLDLFAKIQRGHSAKPNNGNTRKQIIKSLKKSTSLIDDSEQLVSLVDLLDISEEKAANYKAQIESLVSLAVAPVETQVEEELDDISADIEDIQDEFESDEDDLSEDEFDSADNAEEFETEEFETEDEDSFDIDTEEEDEDEEDNSAQVAALVAKGKPILRKTARSLGMSISQSVTKSEQELALYIINNQK